ncbi:MAG TPA: dienelactone hydrolase family protein [Gemmatimonadales bacterium]|nr:dienelactone hydrolase family protein [Gemmatimonadales bacterium]
MVAPAPHGGQAVEGRGRPLGEGRAVLLLVHGRNAAPRNILDLVPALQHPEFTYLAPAAANQTWYPQSFLAETEKNEPGITSGIAVIHGLIEECLRRGIPSQRIVVLGFSQGACLACTAAFRRPARYGGVVAYSGGLIGPPGTVFEAPRAFEGTPVFLGCSDVDAHVPKTRVDETAAAFERAGAQVVERIYPGMGHIVNDDEMAFTRELMERTVSTSTLPDRP